MIEIKNIVKTYRPKKGGEVKALDDVSLKFPEKGLVFILGKSGSGKSTLLNVMGGLDTADSGEIIIKGKSSKEFSTGDFDSYRNTYLGFIFQEYNILEDFNVGANVALALKLQGRKATDEEIIKAVGITAYGLRNTRRQLRAFSEERLMRAYRDCVEAEYAVKSGAMSDEEALGRLMLSWLSA